MNTNEHRLSRYVKRLMVVISLMLLSGCYYEVRDASTGKMYYTEKWVAADGYRGPLTITNEQGQQIRIQNAEVVRLNQEDYRDATTKPEDKSNSPAPSRP